MYSYNVLKTHDISNPWRYLKQGNYTSCKFRYIRKSQQASPEDYRSPTKKLGSRLKILRLIEVVFLCRTQVQDPPGDGQDTCATCTAQAVSVLMDVIIEDRSGWDPGGSVAAMLSEPMLPVVHVLSKDPVIMRSLR